ncbi:hypothetical protein [Nitrobacter sp. JJSN]|uniref:hypothetical protein n=1 Tax=Nitrobacter sp. JJSN TaxID=3453033 RepID=UPI003F7747CB
MLHSHDRDHAQAHEHGHAHGHTHGPSSPHPSQVVPWSILRMALITRLGTALAVSLSLWVAVVLAMK